MANILLVEDYAANYQTGFIKLYRSMLDHPVFAHPVALKIWVWCLLKANHTKKSVSLKIGKGSTIVNVLPGQFIFGRFKAEDELNIDGSTIYKWIQKFSSNDFDLIKIESNNQYSIVSICNWATYQSINGTNVTTIEQPSNKQVTTDEQPSNTTKNEKNDKNERNIYRKFKHLSLTTDEYKKIIEQGYTAIQLMNILDDIENYSGNKRYTSLYLTALKWLKKDKPKSSPLPIFK